MIYLHPTHFQVVFYSKHNWIRSSNNLESSDYDDLSIIAFVKNSYTRDWTDPVGNSFVDSPSYDVYNTQQVKIGEVVSFD